MSLILTKPKITYKTLERIAVIGSDAIKSQQKELRLVSWKNGRAKYDLRVWQYKPEYTEDADDFIDNEMPLKGITLTDDELIALRDALNKLD